jgi:hypothetical protein
MMKLNKYIMVFVASVIFTIVSVAQINYTTGFEVVGERTDWDVGGFNIDTDRPCNGSYSADDNIWSSDTEVLLYKETTLGTSLGGEMTISFDAKVVDYNTTTGSTDPFTLNVRWCSGANTGCTTIKTYTEADYATPGTCTNKSFTYTPAAGANNYLTFQWSCGLQVMMTSFMTILV